MQMTSIANWWVGSWPHICTIWNGRLAIPECFWIILNIQVAELAETDASDC